MSYYSRNKLALSSCTAKARDLVAVLTGNSNAIRGQVAAGLGVKYTGKWPAGTARAQFVTVNGQGWIRDEEAGTKHYGNISTEGLFRLDAAPAPRTRVRWDSKVVKAKSSAHRLHVACPDCASWVPTGRLHQHVGTASCLRLTQVDIGK